MDSIQASAMKQFHELLAKSHKHFNKLRTMPTYGSFAWEGSYHKAFEVFSSLWRYQQDNRQALVEAGLKRSEIGEMASKIGQLYYNFYLRKAETRYLSESFVFYEAIHTRQYFSSDGLLSSNPQLCIKQLRFYARFIIVCLLLNKKEESWNLLQEFQALISAYTMREPLPAAIDAATGASSQQSDPSTSGTAQQPPRQAVGPPADAADWQLVVHEITAFMHADVAMPEPRSPGTSISFKPNLRCCPTGPMLSIAPHSPRLKEVVFVSYQARQVKIAELPLDVFRIMQSLEWRNEECAGQNSAGSASLVPPRAASPSNGDSSTTQSEPLLSSQLENPSRQHFYRTTTPALLAVLGSTVNNISGQDIMLLYLSCLSSKVLMAAPCSAPDGSASTAPQLPEALSHGLLLCPQKGAPASSPLSDLVLMPEDLLPLTRRRLMLILDGDAGPEFQRLVGAEYSYPVLCLASPQRRPSLLLDNCRTGSLFTMFLSCPIMAFCLLCGESDPTSSKLGVLQSALDDVMIDLGRELLHGLKASVKTEAPVKTESGSEDGSSVVRGGISQWADAFSDVLIRQHLLRFVLCRAALSMHGSTYDDLTCQPTCFPDLPEAVSASSAVCKAAVAKVAGVLKKEAMFKGLTSCTGSNEIANGMASMTL